MMCKRDLDTLNFNDVPFYCLSSGMKFYLYYTFPPWIYLSIFIYILSQLQCSTCSITIFWLLNVNNLLFLIYAEFSWVFIFQILIRFFNNLNFQTPSSFFNIFFFATDITCKYKICWITLINYTLKLQQI